ncbi:hypothetical protein PYW08_012185 [Mythimna loreyi]|uniref:Uncharacterized protein n=1 Tax=Mythimna loreyi TaxID=667449 RepID=A0ACC2Q1W6_9NEOP|nr:hypothetical protein PYW08_012185 [Mythimna loreyi]
MQRYTSKENEIKIPPNLLKNFNVYEILEPQKNCAISSDGTTVDKLIDIDDCSRDSGFQDSDLHPAFFDKNRDFDLVDLYQNIFVTPQHIVKKKEFEDFCIDETTSSQSNVFDAGFKQFFDKLESGEKVDWTNIAITEEETAAKNDYIEKPPKVLVPKVFTEPDSDPEDVIYEVLTQKKLEKLVLDRVSEAPRTKSSPEVIASETKEYERPKIQQTDVTAELPRLYSVNGLAKGSKFENAKEILPRPSETYMVNSSTNFTVRAIQKDEKVYKKKRVQKPESQTANFTKGPDFYEKSVVLPQIMARLDARLALLQEKENQKRRLILDTGIKPHTTEETTNVQVKKTPTSNMQVSSGIPKPQAQVIPTKKLLPKATGSGIHSINFNNIPLQKVPQMCMNKNTKDIRVHTTDKTCLNCGKVPESKKEDVTVLNCSSTFNNTKCVADPAVEAAVAVAAALASQSILAVRRSASPGWHSSPETSHGVSAEDAPALSMFAWGQPHGSSSRSTHWEAVVPPLAPHTGRQWLLFSLHSLQHWEAVVPPLTPLTPTLGGSGASSHSTHSNTGRQWLLFSLHSLQHWEAVVPPHSTHSNPGRQWCLLLLHSLQHWEAVVPPLTPLTPTLGGSGASSHFTHSNTGRQWCLLSLHSLQHWEAVVPPLTPLTPTLGGSGASSHSKHWEAVV